MNTENKVLTAEEKSFCKCDNPKPNYPEMVWCDACGKEIPKSKEEKRNAFFRKAILNKENFELHKALIQKHLCDGDKMYYNDLKVFAEKQVIDNMLLLKLMAYAESYHQQKQKQELEQLLEKILKGYDYLVINKSFVSCDHIISSFKELGVEPKK